MSVCILAQKPYPHGMAITNRIHQIAKGIHEAGGEAFVLIPWPTGMIEENNSEVRGVHEGVPFEYASGVIGRPGSFLSRRWHGVKGSWRAARALFRRRKDLEGVILISDILRQIVFFRLITWLLRVPYIHEKGEFPGLWMHEQGPFQKKNGPVQRAYGWLFLHLSCKAFD
ncbi:hypothetical protein HQ520_11685, partial [bacterium]|nr:hypothetical protein [bacterium]